jgi:hypothetical protein
MLVSVEHDFFRKLNSAATLIQKTATDVHKKTISYCLIQWQWGKTSSKRVIFRKARCLTARIS